MAECKDCGWWNTEPIKPSYDGELVGGMRNCLFLSEAKGMDYAHPTLGDAGIITSPEFGCIFWRAKDG